MPMKSLKKLSLAIALAVAAFLAVGSAHAIPTWAENYGVGSYNIDGTASSDPFYGSGVDTPRAIAPMPDGGFVVAGQVAFPFLTINSSYGGKSDACLLRFAADGTILWQFELRQLGNDYAYGSYSPAVSYISYVRTDAQGNIFAAGGKGNPYNNGQVPFVAKFSPAGELIWQNGIPLAGGTIPGTPPQSYQVGVGSAYIQMGLTNDGGVVITGSQGRPAGYSVPIIAKFDSNGTVSLYHAYENPDQYAPNGPVAQMADGSNYVTVIRYPVTSNNQGPIYGLALFVLSATDGSIVAQRGWPSLDGGSEQPIALIRTADGGFASLSIKTDFAGLVFRKFNADASATTVERVINPSAGQQRFYVGSFSEPADLGSFSQTSDGGFLIGGHTSKPSSGYGEDAAVMKLNADGTLAFVSVIGGVWGEGNLNGGSSGSVATPLTDGGYGIAITSATYTTQPAGEDFRQKPDWWVVKTDTNRKVRNFTGIMADLDPGSFSASASSPQSPMTLSYLSNPTYTAGPLPSTDPAFALIDLGTRIGIDLPALAIQASSPRIVSSNRAEAVVQQHFAYHPLTAFFPDVSKVTFSATNLPQGFVIDPKTGVISGVPAVGSETTTPISISLQATDGTDTTTFTLNLTIGDGSPFFTVNGSDQPVYPPSGTPVSNQTDKVLTFVSRYPGKQAGRVMTVQATTTPDNEASWQPLTNGTTGVMPYDLAANVYVLGTTNYPLSNAVYFRARVRSPQSIVTSNIVGPFDLASNQQHLGMTNLFINHNGPVANIRFGVTEELLPSGIAVQVQATTTPTDEGSWTDVPNGSLQEDTTTIPPAPHEFYGGFDNYPDTEGVYFRAVATASGYVKSVSGMNGPFTFIRDPAATVTLTVPGASGTGGTDFDFPIIPSSQSFNVSAAAQSSRQIKYLGLMYDGDTLDHFAGNQGAVQYTTSVAGDHIIEAIATDDLGVVGDAQPVHVRVAPAAPGKIYFLTASGDWSPSNSAIWTDGQGNSGVPGPQDFAVLGSVSVNLTGDITVRALSLNGGTISGPGKLTVTGFCTVGGGVIKSNVDIADGATLLLINDTDLGLGARITNFGRVKFHGKGGITGGTAAQTGIARADGRSVSPDGFLDFVGELFNKAVTFFQRPAGGRKGSTNPSTSSNPAPSSPVPEARKVEVAKIDNGGKVGIIGNDGASLIGNDGAGLIGNDGAGLIGNDGAGLIGNDGAGLIDKNGNKLTARAGADLVARAAASSLIGNDGAGLASRAANVVATGSTNLIGNDGAGLFPHGAGGRPSSSQAAAASTAAGYTQSGGELDLNGISLVGAVQLSGGIVSGNGAIIGDLTNDGGFLAPGHSAGTVGVTGSFTQTAGGALVLEAAGGETGQFDQVQVGGSAALDGKLLVHTINGYMPLAGDPFAPMTYNSVSGSFSAVTSNASITLNAAGLVAVINPAASNPPYGQPTNISTRMKVLTDDNVLIGGFIVSGPSGSTKKVLIHGLGPSLSSAHLSGLLSDPFLEFHYPDGRIVTNDNWGDAPNKDQIPDGFAPTDARESILILDLAPAVYTVIVKGAHGETGIGMTEVYDIDGSTAVSLTNVSTRGYVDTGDNVMIGGFIVGGSEPATMLVKVPGPSLKNAPASLTGVLEDPMLELHDSYGNVITNDNWRETQEAEITATGLAPKDDKEPAILATLVPGVYTALVRGKDNSTGIALVEAYKIK